MLLTIGANPATTPITSARNIGFVNSSIINDSWDGPNPVDKILEATRNDYKAVWGAPKVLNGQVYSKTFNKDKPPTGFIPCARNLIAEEQERINNKVSSISQSIFHWAAHELDEAIRGNMLQSHSNIGGVQKYDQLADGIIVVHTLLHTPIQISGNNYKIMGASFGDSMGVAYISHHTTMNFSSLLTHEIGHILFMRHFAIGDGGAANDHDVDDRNCIMTYPFIWVGNAVNPVIQEIQRVLDVKKAFFRFRWDPNGNLLGQFTDNQFPINHDPKFCGKCNFKLRGWNILAAGLPASTTGNNLPQRAPF
jgi:hypothetical protein